MRTANDISDKSLKRITGFLNESSCLPIEEISAIDHQTLINVGKNYAIDSIKDMVTS